MNIQTVAKIQVCAMFRAGDLRRNVLFKFGSPQRRHVYVPSAAGS